MSLFEAEAVKADTRLTQPAASGYHDPDDHKVTSPTQEEAMASTATKQQTYNVGGVMLQQPFKIRRLGHFGFNVANMEQAVHFYRDLLGFRVSDILDFKQLPHMRDALQHVEDGRGYFFHHGHDHHTFVLFPKQVMDAFMAAGGGGGGGGQVTINQITWQTGSLAEVVHGAHFFRDKGIPIQRVGRDMPGSNWHVYPKDPDGHVNELYYGIEQIGWLGRSKPKAMYYRKFSEEPSLPQMSEEAEVEEAVQKGIDIYSGYRDEPNLPATVRCGRGDAPPALRHHQDWPGRSVRAGPGGGTGLLRRQPGVQGHRRGGISRLSVGLPQAWRRASQPGPVPQGTAAGTGVQPAHDLGVVRDRGRELQPVASCGQPS